MAALTTTMLQNLIDRFNRYFERLKPDRSGLFYLQQVFNEIYPNYYQAGMLSAAQHKGLTQKLDAFKRRVREVEAGRPDPYGPLPPVPPVGYEPTLDEMVPLPAYEPLKPPEYYEFTIRDTATVEFLQADPYIGGTVSPGTAGLPSYPKPLEFYDVVLTDTAQVEFLQVDPYSGGTVSPGTSGIPETPYSITTRPYTGGTVSPGTSGLPWEVGPYVTGFDIKKAALPLILGIGGVALFAAIRG